MHTVDGFFQVFSPVHHGRDDIIDASRELVIERKTAGHDLAADALLLHDLAAFGRIEQLRLIVVSFISSRWKEASGHTDKFIAGKLQVELQTAVDENVSLMAKN